jgi:hypothetical protein
VASPVFQLDVGPNDEILHGARDQDLPRPGERSDPGSHVHGDSLDTSVHNLTLSCVKADPDSDPERSDPLVDGSRALLIASFEGTLPSFPRRAPG